LVNEVALTLFIGMFGWKITVIYAISGIVLGTVWGRVLGRLNLQNYLSKWAKTIWKNSQSDTLFGGDISNVIAKATSSMG
jgi:uncharacterized membrane protein YraQ (UPF0718 family)